MTNLLDPQVPMRPAGLAALARESWQAFSGLVWPVRCPGCGAPDVPICGRCQAAVAGPAFVTPMVGWPLGWGSWAAAGYHGVPGRLLIAWKERGRRDLTGPLGVGLGAAVRACREAHLDPLQEWLLVPVPSSRAARRRRGTDLMVGLARAAAASCRSSGSSGEYWPGPPPRSLPALRQVRAVRDQGGLSAVERRANLRGALAVRRSMGGSLNGRSVVVVDDVVTTGTTAAEAARVLTAAGAHVVGHCFLSVTLRQQGVAGRHEED